MNKSKAVFWIVVIGLLMLVFFQNQNFFLAKQSMRINLVFVKYQTPELTTAVFFLVLFAIGLLISYLLCLPERYRLRKAIKKLTAVVDSQNSEIAALKIDSTPSAEEAPVVSQGTNENSG